MKISLSNNETFILPDATYADAQVAKYCGFTFDSRSALWHSADADSVRRLRSNSLKLSGPLTISKAALEKYKAAGEKVLTAVEESRAEDSDLNIPVPEGLALLPFQRAGVAYIVKRFRLA